MFLIGLNLLPQKLLKLFNKMFLLTILTCFIYAFILTLCAIGFGLSITDSIIFGLALMFSSTIIGIKLLPTTYLHQKKSGEVMISVLLLQDILAIILLLILSGSLENIYLNVLFLILRLLGLIICSILVVKYCVLYFIQKFDVIQDYIFVLALGLCLFTALAAKLMGLSYEIGAFIAGVSLAISPISLVISEKLKPLREFFLILFFFALGAQFNFLISKQVWLLSLVASIIIIIGKPYIYLKAFGLFKIKSYSKGLELRLGQASEFSLLVAYAAFAGGKISDKTNYSIQLIVIITFVASTILVIKKLPTPISTDYHKRRD